MKYLLSPDWSEPETWISGFLGNQSCFENSTFQPASLSSFLSSPPFHPRPCRISSPVAIIPTHLLTPPFLFVRFCVTHTNVWHYDMMTQCSLLNLSFKKQNGKKTRRQNRTTRGQLSFVTAEKARIHATSSSSTCGPFSQSSLLVNINEA